MASRLAVRANITGVGDLRKKLLSLAGPGRKRAARKGIGKGNVIVSKAEKGKVARRTKLLRESIGHKTKTYRSGGTVAGIIGARGGFKRQLSVTLPDGRVVVRPIDPVKYAHLAEKGRKGVKTGKRSLVGLVIAGRRGGRPGVVKKLFAGKVNVTGKRGAVRSMRSYRYAAQGDYQFFGRSVRGAFGKPYVKPAVDQNRGAVADVVADAVNDEIRKLAI